MVTLETAGSWTITAADTVTASITGTSTPIAVTATAAPVVTSGGAKQFHLQNAIYTSQWWIFAVLVVVYWGRLLRDERATRSQALPAT